MARRSRPSPRPPAWLRLLAAAIVVLVGVAEPVAAQPSGYQPPVDVPVVDPFRPPPSPYAAGNRGLEYDTTPGTVVRAAGDGTVVFAGSVAGTLHVTVLHGDGLRTTYSFLASASVRRGDTVAGGDQVGTSGERLHFGVRSGDTYLDPASLFGRAARHAHLVPADEVRSSTVAAELAAVRGWLAVDRPGLLGAEVGWVRDRVRRAGRELGALPHYAEALDPNRFGADIAIDVVRHAVDPPQCTPAEGRAGAPAGSSHRGAGGRSRLLE